MKRNLGLNKIYEINSFLKANLFLRRHLAVCHTSKSSSLDLRHIGPHESLCVLLLKSLARWLCIWIVSPSCQNFTIAESLTWISLQSVVTALTRGTRSHLVLLLGTVVHVHARWWLYLFYGLFLYNIMLIGPSSILKWIIRGPTSAIRATRWLNHLFCRLLCICRGSHTKLRVNLLLNFSLNHGLLVRLSLNLLWLNIYIFIKVILPI